MSSEKQSTAALRIASSAYSAAAITAALGVSPSRTFGPKKGRSVWSLTAPLPEEAAMERHLSWIADVIDARWTGVESIRDKCDIDVFCSYSTENGQGSIVMEAKTMERFARRGIDVIFDLYLIDSGADESDAENAAELHPAAENERRG